MRYVNLRVTYRPPPIPTRSQDWCATLDNYEPGDPIGYGATSAAAIAELMEQIDES